MELYHPARRPLPGRGVGGDLTQIIGTTSNNSGFLPKTKVL
jgi:hypothetical protein